MGKSEMVLSKMFSARWFMTITATLGSTLLVFLGVYICYKAKNMEAGIAILMAYLAIWKEIAMFYFQRDRSSDPKMEPTEAKPSA